MENLEKKVELKNFLLSTSLLVAGQTADILATGVGLTNGLAEEGNPVMEYFINNLGTYEGLIIPKLLVSASLIYVAIKAKSKLGIIGITIGGLSGLFGASCWEYSYSVSDYLF